MWSGEKKREVNSGKLECKGMGKHVNSFIFFSVFFFYLYLFTFSQASQICWSTFVLASEEPGEKSGEMSMVGMVFMDAVAIAQQLSKKKK
jgi:hypothetical protein